MIWFFSEHNQNDTTKIYRNPNPDSGSQEADNITTWSLVSSSMSSELEMRSN